jgi:tetratricopeptide (TPR) repeat protein
VAEWLTSGEVVCMTDPVASDLQQRLAAALSGQYRVDRLLGQGGMGAVFLAHDEALDRPVAIKVISPEVTGTVELRQRFIQESRSVAKLRHPNIVQVYAAGEKDGLLYFAMEFVPGESLRDRLTRDGRLDEASAVNILHELALALDHAHAAGIVHRDIKPENVLLDRDGRAMLTDFGVARGLSSASQLTGAGFVLGSPRYMSPEQASGEPVDGRSDLYSVGLVGYELLTGAIAVDANSAAAILVKHLTERVPPVQQAANGVSDTVANAVNRLLEKEPNDRFQRGAAFAAALLGEPYDDSASATTRPRSTSGARTAGAATGGSASAKTPTARSRRPIAIAAGVLAVAAGGIGYAMTGGSSTNAKEWLVAPFEVQGPDRSLDWLREGSLNMLTLSLAQWQDLHVVDYEHTLDLLRDAKIEGAARVGLEQARGIAKKAGAGRVVTGQVTEIGDSLIVTASLYDVAKGDATDKARAAAKKGTDPRILFADIAGQLLDLQGAPRLSVDLVQQTTSSIEAYRLYLSGLKALNSWRIDAADTMFTKAIALDTTFALAYYRKSLALAWSGVSDSTRLQWSEKALQHAQRLPTRLQELVRAHVEQTKAFMASSVGDTVAARVGFLASRERVRKLLATDSTDAEAWFSLGDTDYHLVWNTSYGYKGDSTVKYANESVQAFRRTIALDSSFHLAYSHLVDIYNRAAVSPSFIVLRGDSIVLGGYAKDEAKLGTPEQVAALRTAASLKAREAAHGWIAADPDAVQARMALAENFTQAREADSAIRVFKDALARPSTANPFLTWNLLAVQGRNWRAEVATEFSTRLARFTADSIKRLAPGQARFISFSAITAASALGRPSLLAPALALLAPERNEQQPGTSITLGDAAQYYSLATRAATVGAMTPAERGEALTLTRRMRELPPAGVDPSLAYLFFRATGDTAFRALATAMQAARGDSAGFPELMGLAALDKGDTATAQRVVKSFPGPELLRSARIGSSGLRVVTRAELLDRLGDTKRAVELLAMIDPSRFGPEQSIDHTAAIYARQFAFRGRLYEKLGERDQAIAAYERFTQMWKNADEPLQPEVRAAREAIARLRDGPAATTVKGAGAGTR